MLKDPGARVEKVPKVHGHSVEDLALLCPFMPVQAGGDYQPCFHHKGSRDVDTHYLYVNQDQGTFLYADPDPGGKTEPDADPALKILF